jgi:hypothetical protein
MLAAGLTPNAKTYELEIDSHIVMRDTISMMAAIEVGLCVSGI